jgi:hypothetical protein
MRRDHRVDGGLEGIEVVGVDAPEHFEINAVIGVPQDVAEVGYVLPWHVWTVCLPPLGRYSSGGLAHDLKVPLEEQARVLVSAHFLEGEAPKQQANVGDRFLDVTDTKQDALGRQNTTTWSR